jgi:acylphosphatase
VSESSSGGVRLRAYRVHGRVEGVGFRWRTRSVAVQLGLGGRVQNLSTGSVEVHAAGRLDMLEQFEAQVAEGPQFARVTSIENIEPDGEMLHESFDIVLQ